MSGEVAVVLGTRPEIIKLAGVLEQLAGDAVLVHTGQHYDDELSQVFLDGLNLPAPDIHLGVGGGSRAEQIGRGVVELDRVLREVDPCAVVVQGDTNSALAGALAANACGVSLVHVEAGLRSYDKAMPEEHNRVLIDHLADLLAAPTPTAVANLRREGIAGAQVICTGNTVVEAVHRQLPDETGRQELLARFGVRHHRFALATVHRPENTDDPEALAAVLDALRALPMPVLAPLHPRTLAAVERHGLASRLDGLRVTAPLPGPQFLGLACEAALLISDSGGVQEEVTVLGKPLVVVRRSTERPEALSDHAVLARPEQIGDAVTEICRNLPARLTRLGEVPSPYGDGLASTRIAAETLRRFGRRRAQVHRAVHHDGAPPDRR